MAKLNRKGLVYANGSLAGGLLEFRGGMIEAYQFIYNEEYVQPGSPIGYRSPV